MTEQRTRRGPFWSNGLTAAALLVVLAVTALVAQPPTPPSIAEFSPQSQQQIEDAPDEQSAEGASRVEQNREVLTIEEQQEQEAREAAAQIVEVGVPSALGCVVWPDGSVTQTFDAQSPPCVASWPEADQGNGGATTRGVTGDEIVLALQPWSEAITAQQQSVLDFFNSRYQLYGRRFVLRTFAEDAGSPRTAEAQRAVATEAIATGAFAALATPLSYGDNGVYMDTIADAEMIVTEHRGNARLASEQASRSPYQWTYAPMRDTIDRALAGFVCQSLPLSGNAVYGGGDVLLSPRHLAVLVPNTASNGGFPFPRPQILLDAAEACSDEPVEFVEYQFTTIPDDVPGIQQMMFELRAKGVTTIVPYSSVPWIMMDAAESMSYQPEWVAPGAILYNADANWAQSGFSPKGQVAHLMGIAGWSRPVPLAQEAWYRAFHSMDPSAIAQREAIEELYRQVLILAAGVQGAGPNLTPETFANALYATDFANPGAGSGPDYQASFGAKPDGSAMVQDFGVWWWDNTSRSKSWRAGNDTHEPGAGCFFGNGSRFGPRSWPTEPLPLFTGPC